MPIDDLQVKSGWTNKPEEKGKNFLNLLTKFSRLGRWVFWIFISLTAVAAGFTAFYFYNSPGNRDVNFSLKAPSSVLLVVPFDLEFEFKNNSGNVLKDVKISTILPEGTGFVSESQERRAFDKSFGDLNPGDKFQDKISIVVFSGSESVQQFELKTSYFTPGLGSTVSFGQTKSINITIDKPALSLDLTAPQKVLNNENFEIEIHYQNVSDVDFSNAELKLTYPSFFVFEKASSSPSIGNNVWKLGDLAKNGEQKTIIITGRVLSAEESFFDVRGSLSAEIAGQKYLINEKAASLSIAPSPLIMNITLNDQTNYLASLGDNLRYKINYSNNSDVGLNDVVIKAKLIGSMLDLSSFQSNGFFDSNSATITWNAANTPALRVLSAGANGSVEFMLRVKDNYPIKRVSDKNFVLEVQGEISSPTIPYEVASDKTISLANLKTKVSGKVAIDTQLIKGNLPLKVNTPTDFTIHWLITNYSTDISGVEVKTFFQSGVKWMVQVKNTMSNSTLTYNERTQEVIWLIDKIPATKGVVSSPAEVVFQVEVTPNITQANQTMPILSETNLKARDEFSGVNLTSQYRTLNTQEPVMP